MDELNWPLMLGAGIIASASPGPATLGIAGTSMRHGRRAGLSLSAGIMAGSYIWSATAAFGVGAILLAHVWMLETVRYCGGGYLLWLAFMSLRSAMVPGAGKIANILELRGHFTAGLALHITIPCRSCSLVRCMPSARRPAPAPANWRLWSLSSD